MIPTPGRARPRSFCKWFSVICGMSIASTSKCGVCKRANPAATPLKGPSEGGLSNTTGISGGHHDGMLLAETQSAAGRRVLKIRSCRSQSDSPAISIVALSTPMRRERPPARRMALAVVIRCAPAHGLRRRRCSSFRRAGNRQASARFLARTPPRDCWAPRSRRRWEHPQPAPFASSQTTPGR